jgi:hypothetical protein
MLKSDRMKPQSSAEGWGEDATTVYRAVPCSPAIAAKAVFWLVKGVSTLRRNSLTMCAPRPRANG